MNFMGERGSLNAEKLKGDSDSLRSAYLSGKGLDPQFLDLTTTKQVVNAGKEESLFDEEQKCRVCGCTWNNACVGGCYWIEDDLCSSCSLNG